MTRIVVIDGQGGGLGRMIVERVKALAPDAFVIAVGTNALATSAMLRAGADAGATGENAVRYNCAQATLLLAPSGIAVSNAMLGEVSPAIAEAVRQSPAAKHLLPIEACQPGAGKRYATMSDAVDKLVREALQA